MWSGNSDDADQSEMFMNVIMDHGDLAEQTFSFYMAGLDSDSYIDFGTPNSAAMDGSPVYMDTLDGNPWWSQSVTGFRFDSNTDSDQTEYEVTSLTEAITDTGTSCMSGPHLEMDYINSVVINKIAENYTVLTDNSWGYTFDCPSDTSDLVTFEILMGGYWMSVMPEDYIVDISANSDGTICAICLEADKDAYEWLLGDAFMRGWYNIHDHENKRMGFVPYVDSHKSAAILADTTPSTSVPDDYSFNTTWGIFGFNGFYVVGILLTIFGGIAYCVLKCMGVFAQA